VKPYFENEFVTIYHGDFRDVLPSLHGFTLAIADPPYGAKQAQWDSQKPDPVLWKFLYNSLDYGGILYYWGFWGHADWVLTHAKQVGFLPLSRIVWWFRTGRPEKFSYREDTEEAWYFSKGEPTTFNADLYLEPYIDDSNYKRYGREGKHPGTVWIASRVLHNHPGNYGHETQKPESLISKMIGISTNKGDSVLDPTMGSGTTLFCAQLLQRKAVGIDISERYCEMAANRCMMRPPNKVLQLTGKGERKNLVADTQAWLPLAFSGN
jgi:DNA modification methylase